MWSFIKKNKGKLAIGGAVMGTAYVGYRALSDYKDVSQNMLSSRMSQLWKSSANLIGLTVPDHSSAEEAETTDLIMQTRKHYIFDSNQRTCDHTVRQLLPILEKRLLQRYDIAKLRERLTTDSDVMSNEEKKDIWEEMKWKCVSRLLVAQTSTCLIILTLKTQVNILASRIYSALVQTSLGQLPRHNDVIHSQQVFAQILHHFMQTGFNRLCELVDTVTKTCLQDIGLTGSVDMIKLNELLRISLIRLNAALKPSSFFQFVIPDENRDPIETTSVLEFSEIWDNCESGTTGFSELQSLISELQHNLNGDHAKAVWKFLIEDSIDQTEKLLLVDTPELKTMQLPMIKIIPLLSDVFGLLYHDSDCQQMIFSVSTTNEDIANGDNNSIISVSSHLLNCDLLRQYGKSIFECGLENNC